MQRTALLLLCLFLATSCLATSSYAGKKSEKENCGENLKQLAKDHPVRLLGREPLMDLMPGQTYALAAALKKKLMEQRQVPPSKELNAEVEKRIFSKIMKDAGQTGSADAYRALTPAKQEIVMRSLLARIGDFSKIAESKDERWFKQKDSFDGPTFDAFFLVKNSWVAQDKIDAWIKELLAESE